VKGPAPVKLGRGKKSKLKKAKKYAWQDDEDRRQYMEMLGHKVVSVQGDNIVVDDKSKKTIELEQKLSDVKQKSAANAERESKKLRKDKEEEELLKMLREEKIELLSPEDQVKHRTDPTLLRFSRC